MTLRRPWEGPLYGNAEGATDVEPANGKISLFAELACFASPLPGIDDRFHPNRMLENLSAAEDRAKLWIGRDLHREAGVIANFFSQAWDRRA